MTKYLIETLTKHSSEVVYAKTTNSIYFTIKGIKVRVSDHDPDKERKDYDLAIIPVIDRFLCIPRNIPNLEYYPCTSTKRVIEYINNLVNALAFIKRPPKTVFPPETLKEENDNLKKCQALGLFKTKGFRTTKKNINKLSKDMLKAVLTFIKTSKMPLPQIELAIGSALGCSSTINAFIDYIKIWEKKYFKSL